jgi:hypothetical protein
VNILAALRSMIVRVKVNRSGQKPQLAWLGVRLSPETEIMRPQGVYFLEPADAQGVMVCPGGDPSVGVGVGVGGDLPSDPAAAGEGGLHYLGAWKVYLNTAGEVHLGQQIAPDFVALASLVTAQLNAIRTQYNAHTHLSAAPASPTGAPVIPMTAIGNVAATKVKAL